MREDRKTKMNVPKILEKPIKLQVNQFRKNKC